MKRRDFVKDAAALAGLAAGAGAVAAVQGCGKKDEAKGTAAVRTDKKVRWRLASSFPRGLDTIFGAAEVLAERVEALTGGNFKIKVHAAGEIVPGLQVLDAVQQGSADVGHTASYYYTGKNPALAFDTCVPFGLTSRQQFAWLLKAGGLEQMRKVFADFGVINFPGGNTGAQMGGWFKRNIQTLDDLKGLKMRIPGLGGEVMSRLGVTVQVLPGGDIYPALERGAIDATEWVGPYDDEKLGFYKVAKLYYYPGWWEPGPALTLLVNKKAWEKLPKSYQQIFELAAQEASLGMQASYDAKNPPALQRLLQAGVKLTPFSDEIMKAAHDASFGLFEEQAKKSPDYKRVYEHWKKAREGMFQWFSTAELAYAKFALTAG